MKQCSLPLVFFICPDPNHSFLHPFALSLCRPISHSWGSAIVLVIAEESMGALCQCVCVWRWGGGLEKWGRWWQFINTWAAHGSVLAEGGEAAQKATLRVFLCEAGHDEMDAVSPPLHQIDKGGMDKERKREREKGRGKGLSSVCRLPLPPQAAAFLPHQFPLHHLHHPPPPPLIPGSKPLKVCSATV